MGKARYAFWADDCTIRREVREWRDRRLKPLGRSIQQSLNDSGWTLETTGGSRSILLMRDASLGCRQQGMTITWPRWLDRDGWQNLVHGSNYS